MAGHVEQLQAATRHLQVNDLTHGSRGDGAVRALQHERRDRHVGEIGAIVGQEGHALASSSSARSGQSRMLMITGAIVWDHPR